jgi:hypothetical protein
MGSGVSKPSGVKAPLLESELDGTDHKLPRTGPSSGKYSKEKAEYINPPGNKKYAGVFVGCLMMRFVKFFSLIIL